MLADGREAINWLFSQVPAALELEKFVEDVKNGVYPILSRDESRSKTNREPTHPRAKSPDQVVNSEKSETPEPNEVEQRTCLEMKCLIEANPEGAPTMTLTLKLEDKMTRHLSTELNEADISSAMSEELVKYGLINDLDKDKLSQVIEEGREAYSAKLIAALSIEKQVDHALQQPIAAM